MERQEETKATLTRRMERGAQDGLDGSTREREESEQQAGSQEAAASKRCRRAARAPSKKTAANHAACRRRAETRGRKRHGGAATEPAPRGGCRQAQCEHSIPPHAFLSSGTGEHACGAFN
jgi:hypothetical protein